MSFSRSSDSVRLEAPAVLRARCGNGKGKKVDATLDLDALLGNDDGRFDVARKNFTATALNICLEGSVLHADLYKANGQLQHATFDLDHCVSNENSQLKFYRGYFYADKVAADCPNCKRFPIGPSGGPKWDAGFSISVGDLTASINRSNCPICDLLKRIAEHLSKTDQRYGYPNTICRGGHQPGQIQFEFKDDGRKQGHAEIKRYLLYKNNDAPVESETFADISNRKHIGFDPRSNKTILQPRKWIDECVRNHKKCARTKGPNLPTRILDLGTGDSKTIRLVITTGQTGIYACLSYCWGDAVGANLARGNLDEFKRGVQITSLPKTYQDAIVFCRRLSIRYLWIDALCIMQKDEEDWLQESVKMDQYYGDSFLCVAATSSKNLDAGCSAHASPLSSVEFTGQGRDNKPYTLYARPELPALPHINDDTQSSHFPLLTRAWCYQERRLAPRVVHFTGEELFFECKEMSACQCGQLRDQIHFRAWTKDNEAFYVRHKNISTTEKLNAVEHEWFAYVHGFSGLNLTKTTDRLPAISGVAKQCKRSKDENHIPPGRYLAGLWENQLIDGMSWCVGKDLTGRRVDGGMGFLFGSKKTSIARMAKPKEYIAPSWSWASVLDRVQYNTPFSQPLCTIVSAETSLVGESPFGSVNGGFVALRGKLHSCRGEWIGSGFFPRYWGLINFPGRNLRKCMQWFPDYDLHELGGKLPDLFLMPLTSRPRWRDHQIIAKLLSIGYLTVYLVLKSREAGTYERIGWTYTKGDAIDTGAQEVDIKIV